MDGLGTTHLSSPLAEGHYINLESRSRINVSTRHRLMVCFPSLSCTVAINVRPHTIAYKYWNVMSQRPDASSCNLDFRKLW